MENIYFVNIYINKIYIIKQKNINYDFLYLNF